MMTTLEEYRDLAETARGFRCSYAFYRGAVVIVVNERQLRFDDKVAAFVAYWFTRSSVAMYFGTSREQVRFVVEHHLALYDNELAATLGPLWASWDDVPAAAPSEPQRPPLSQTN